MPINFKNISYLKNGNVRQKEAFKILTDNHILLKLKEFDPILVGTIPINIDIEESDLDIVCYVKNLDDLKKIVIKDFGNYQDFKVYKNNVISPPSLVTNFKIDGFEIEIFGQNTPSDQQNAYRHMLIEHKLLIERGEEFRQKIIELKQNGYKTEPAFAHLLGLEGDPYVELLKYKSV